MTQVFLWILRNFEEHLFYITPLDACLWKIQFFCKYNVKSDVLVTIIEAAPEVCCAVKKVFLEISQNLQENTCARASFLIKL